MFELKILGSSSATPAHHRHLSAQIVTHNDRIFLIDCGEGTQFQMLRFGIRQQRIDAVFISHLHGDHFFGLIGFLCSLSNHERIRELDLFAPPELQEILKIQLKVADTKLRFPLNFHPLTSATQELIFENKNLEVWTIPLEHRIYCNGFLFREKPHPHRFLAMKARDSGIPIEYNSLLKQGNDIRLDDQIFFAKDFMGPSPDAYSYAYCSDTKYSESIIPFIQDVTLLYHEATFMEDMRSKATLTAHSTAKDAGRIAAMANVGALIIGHYSARYLDLQPMLEEARSEFLNVQLAEEGKTILIKKINEA